MEEDDPILRMNKSRNDEAKKDAELQLEMRKKKLESQKKLLESRRAHDEKIQKIRSGKKV